MRGWNSWKNWEPLRTASDRAYLASYHTKRLGAGERFSIQTPVQQPAYLAQDPVRLYRRSAQPLRYNKQNARDGEEHRARKPYQAVG